MTTFSHKDMKPVREGRASSNDEACREAGYDQLVGSSLNGYERDKFIVDDIYKQEMEYHAGNPEGQQMAKQNKAENMKWIES